MKIISRKDFIMSIKCDVFKDMINNYFDESMALYDLIGDKITNMDMFIGMDIAGEQSDKSSYGIVFNLETVSIVNATEIKRILDKYKVSCYDHNYSVKTNIEDKKVRIKFNEEVSG